VATFGPGQPLHFGLRLGAHIEHTPLANAATPVLAFPQVGEGVSYRFSWLPAVGVIHDGGADFGLYWAPHGYCQSD
jgi:hypothetical protein